MVIATLFIALAVLIVIGAPIAVCIGFAPIAAMVADGQTSQLFVAAQRMVTALDSTVLVAIPLFVLAGVVMGKGGISKQIVNLCYELFGWMPGSHCRKPMQQAEQEDAGPCKNGGCPRWAWRPWSG